MPRRSHKTQADRSLTVIRGAANREAAAFADLCDHYQMLAETGALAVRLAADPRSLKPWLLVVAEAYGQLAEAAGIFEAVPVIDPPGLRRLVSEAYRTVAEVLADPKRPIAAVLDARQLQLALAALDDAAAWRGHRATSSCQDCADSPAELCSAHADDLDRIDQYGALYREFEAVAVPPSFDLPGRIR